MAAGILSKPGSELGPCIKVCGHTDCALTRKMAESLCRVCGKPIEYESYFYREDDDVLVHSLCLYDEMERQAGL